MNMIWKNLLRLRNIYRCCNEFGIATGLALSRQRRKQVDVFKLPQRGLSTPVYCRSIGSDLLVFRQVFHHQDAVIKFGRPPKFIIDAGANVGYSSLLFTMHYPTATIVGVEPDKRNCEMFRKNCSGHPSIRLLEGAIWPGQCLLAIANPDAEAWEFQVTENTSAEAVDRVRAYTIPEIIEMHGGLRVDLLKLDIEGAEHALFTQGSREWLPMIDNILVELHDRYVPGCGQALDELLKNVPHDREQRGEYVHARLRRPE